MDIFFNDAYCTMWAALGVIFQGIASILSILALIYSMTRFRQSLRSAYYTELDSMYFDVLKVAQDKPYLYNPRAAYSGNKKAEYDIYAFMVYNFLETIYDRCGHNKHLCDTWYPVIFVEDRKHKKWFDDPGNKDKFKPKFREFIWNFRREHKKDSPSAPAS